MFLKLVIFLKMFVNFLQMEIGRHFLETISFYNQYKHYSMYISEASTDIKTVQ